MNDKDKMLA